MPENHSRTMSENPEIQRLQRLEEDFHQLRPQVTELKTDVAYIRQSVRQLLDRASQPTNWGWLIAGVTMVAMLLGGYTNLVAARIEAYTIANTAAIQRLESRQHERSELVGSALARLDSLEEARREATERFYRAEDRIIRTSNELAFLKGYIAGKYGDNIEGND